VKRINSRQQFDIPIQAAIGVKVISREKHCVKMLPQNATVVIFP
jgi:translation elongation factor EF-4